MSQNADDLSNAMPASNLTPSVWLRFIARTADMMIFGFVAMFALAVAGMTNGIDQYLAMLIATPAALVVEVFVLSIFGNTPCKAFLKIKVVTGTGESPSLSQYAKRNFMLFIHGFGASIPIVSTITMIYQAVKVRNTGTTTYDTACKTAIAYGGAGIVRTALSIVAIVLMLVLFNVIEMAAGASHQQRARLENGVQQKSSFDESTAKAQGQQTYSDTDSAHDAEMKLALKVADEVVSRHAEFDQESPLFSQPAVDRFIALRNELMRSGLTASNAIASAEVLYIAERAAAEAKRRPATTERQRRNDAETRLVCDPKPVMTDEEIERCRLER